MDRRNSARVRRDRPVHLGNTPPARFDARDHHIANQCAARHRVAPVEGHVHTGNRHKAVVVHRHTELDGVAYVGAARVDPDLPVEQALARVGQCVDTFQSSALNGPDTPAFRVQSSNIFGTSGERHRQQRRLLLPAFHKQRVEAYHRQMVHFTEQLLTAWRPGEVRDIAADMQRLTLDIVTTALFDRDVSERTAELGRQLPRWLTLIVSPAGRLRWDAPFTPYGQLIRLTDSIVATIRTLIAEKRAARALGDDMLSMLIQTADEDGTRLTDDALIGHSSGLFIAGHETSANALSWTLLLLAQHPAILADLVAELTGALGGAAPAIEQLGQLPLLAAVIKESLRLFPPASLLGRIAVAATELDGHAVPEGAEVIYSSYITQRIPELFERPLEFRPERWATLKPSPYAYLPFSAGPRMCLGTAFASLELSD